MNVDCGIANVKPHAGKWHYMYSFDNLESAFESFRAERTDVPVAKATRHACKLLKLNVLGISRVSASQG